MDIARQSEIYLRGSGYDTWSWYSDNSHSITCFESATIMGFIYVFSSAEELISKWKFEQQKALSSHSAALRMSGDKAWNVYSVFLTGDKDQSRQREVEQIEEDFSLTRKIARVNINTSKDIEYALLPITEIKAKPIFSDAGFEDKFRSRLSSVSDDVLNAFLGDQNSEEIAKMLLEQK
ncbi:MAG: hypothetical protein ISN29_00225 [Gammaproteobacteria bacterium AqS3]|nr:hypothetical protein [Gammaproteobacteria bacterium AqS3]